MNLVCGPARGHRFNSCRGFRFFLCPMLATCWSNHFSWNYISKELDQNGKGLSQGYSRNKGRSGQKIGSCPVIHYSLPRKLLNYEVNVVPLKCSLSKPKACLFFPILDCVVNIVDLKWPFWNKSKVTKLVNGLMQKNNYAECNVMHLSAIPKKRWRKLFGTIYIQFSDDQRVSICPRKISTKTFWFSFSDLRILKK